VATSRERGMSPFSRACFNRLAEAGSVFSALLASAIACSVSQAWIMQDVALRLYEKKNGKDVVIQLAYRVSVTNSEIRKGFHCYNNLAISHTAGVLLIEQQGKKMKKLLVTSAILSMLSAQVFAQEAIGAAAGNAGNAAAAAGQAAGAAGSAAGATGAAAGTAAAGTAAAGTAAAAATSGGFFGIGAIAGLSTSAAVAVGSAVAAVAVAASDNNSTTTHH
jgi:hypothetical protein